MKRSYRLLFLIGFAILASVFVTKTSVFRVDAQGRVVFQKKEPKLKTRDLVDTVRAAGDALVSINEVDSDQASTDTAEFVELKASPNTTLDGFALVFYNGNGDVSYAAFDLDGFATDSNGYFIVGNSGVPGVDIVIGSSSLQNGQDAVALYLDDATSFPNGTAVSTQNLVDAVVYDTGQADDPGILVLLNPDSAQVQIDENLDGTGTTKSIQRCSAELRDGRAFAVNTPTPNAANACPQKANVDMNGDGVTDYVITREIGASLTNAVQPRTNRTKGDRRMAQLAAREQRAADAASAVIPIEWWGSNNGASGGTNVVWGDSFFQDNIISADFDGDGADDVAIWRPGPPDTAAFYSINSSDLTYRVDAFGQNGDNTTIVGDYDGDGRDDSASFRCPELGSDPGQCYFFYRASSNNPTNGITYIPWGFGDSLTYYPYPGDFDGDGKHDFCLQAANPDAPQQAIFVLQLNDANYSQEFIHWGYSSDFLAPGDYDGDGRSDFTVVRNENRDGLDRRVFYILHRDGTTRGAEWGITDTDDIVPGDYDGDGAQDIAVYRWNSPEPRFWILPSNGDPHFTFQFGLTGDVPVATWYVQ